jgi:hemolysin III
MNAPPSVQSRREEFANALTHGIAAACCVAVLVVLVVFAALRGDALRIVSLAIFGASLVGLYTASTWYHLARGARLKRALRAVDHAAIFLLIAGTYTPFMLVAVGGAWGWSMFGAVWAIAAAGVVLKLYYAGRAWILSTALYIVMGWLALICIGPVVRSMSTTGLVLLMCGGCAYTLGVVFFAWKTLPYHHAIWHLFVMAGSAFHILAAFTDVLPAS